MPSLLTIPREIRDQIYDWALSDTLASFRSRELQRARKRIQYSPSDPETFLGEDTIQFPVHTSLPPTHGLLHTTRQIRLEFLDSIKRLGSVRYKVDLVDRRDRGVLAPTWISVPFLPCFADRIDVLEVRWRIRERKTSSVISSVGDSKYFLMEGFNGSLALLQRFVERGVYLLSKKKRRKIHIGLLEVHLDVGTELEADKEDIDEFAEESCVCLDEYFMGDMSHIYDGEKRQIFDAQFELLASKIDLIQLYANGGLKREWELDDVVARREEHIRDVARRGEDSEGEL